MIIAEKRGNRLHNLCRFAEKMPFYDALTKPEVIRDFYENDVLFDKRTRRDNGECGVYIH